MSRINYAAKDNAEGQLLANITAADLTIPLESGDGASFPQPYTGSASSTGDSQTLNDTGALADVNVGDFIYNVTDGSWAIVLTEGTDSITTTRLRNGSDNTWQNGDTWRVKQFVITLEIRNELGSVTNREQALIVNRSTDNLIVAMGGRGYNGSTAQAFEAGDYVTLQVTEVFVTDMQAVVAAVAEWADANQTLIKNLQEGAPYWLGTITGTDTLTGTASPARTAYAAGQKFAFKVANENTGAVTININGLGAKNIYKNGSSPLVGGDLLVGALAVVVYDGTQFQLATPVGNVGAGAGDVINDKTFNYSISVDEAADQEYFTNNGATVGLDLTAPTAVAGSRIRAIVRTAQYTLVRPASGDTMRHLTSSSSTNQPGFITNVQYNSIDMLAVDADNWITVGYVGTWNLYTLKGYAMGGNTGVYQSLIDDMNFNDDTSAQIAATVTAAGTSTGVSGKMTGYCMGGDNGGTRNSIEDMVFYGETSDAIAATLDTARYGGFGVQSSTKGYCIGGWNGSNWNTTTAEDISFTAETSAQIASALGTGKGAGASASSSTKGYMMGGTTGSDVDTVATLTFSGETAGTIAAVLTSARNNIHNSSVQSSAKGFAIGGHTSGAVNTINALTFSGETMAALGATLDTARSQGCAVSGPSKSYYMGATATVNVIEDLNHGAETSAAIAATLNSGRGDAAGVYGS